MQEERKMDEMVNAVYMYLLYKSPNTLQQLILLAELNDAQAILKIKVGNPRKFLEEDIDCS